MTPDAASSQLAPILPPTPEVRLGATTLPARVIADLIADYAVSRRIDPTSETVGEAVARAARAYDDGATVQDACELARASLRHPTTRAALRR